MQEIVFVAMSGGVDSSVAAYLLKKQGYVVMGVTMQVWPSGEHPSYGGCCSSVAIEDARRVAEALEIPHYVWNFQELFEEKVINYFCQEYLSGRTPNPCITCNRYIKFDYLLHRVRALGADFLATGHYARIEYSSERKRWILRRGIDLRKDQSYVLFILRQEQMAHLLFPLGSYTKEEVRQIAASAGLPVVAKRESQEICFISDHDYRRFLKERVQGAVSPGPIYNVKGDLVGLHHGLAFYTIGQRRRLGLALGHPVYVVDLDYPRNALVVGREEDVFFGGLVAQGVNFIAMKDLTEPREVMVKIRYTTPSAPALIYPGENAEIRVRFFTPQKAIAPGQAVVFYENDLVLGGGIIAKKIK